MKPVMIWSLLVVLAGSLAVNAQELPLVAEDDFESGSMAAWLPTDASAWTISSRHGSQVLELLHLSDYQPPVRSPHSIALLAGVEVSDFVLDVTLASTDANPNGHQDLCIFFGWQDPSHFYYAHLGAQADPHAHSVMIVDGTARLSIATWRTAGVTWDAGPHQVRLTRSAAGPITVFFDDLPVMRADDTTFPCGMVGLGSFDNTGWFDDFQLRGLPRSGAAPQSN